ncbi:hypothetical protein GOB57_21785 [Sinorhizobium meliloti]|nr:hypothetical protein [Sinorhizobium meliloti]
MRMSQQAYETILEETRIIIGKLEETGAALHPGREFDADNLTLRDMWDIKLVADMDRANASHPRHTHPGLLPRCLEFTDRSPYYLYDRDGEDLDDSHIETAFKKVMATIKAERLDAATKASASAPGPRF